MESVTSIDQIAIENPKVRFRASDTYADTLEGPNFEENSSNFNTAPDLERFHRSDDESEEGNKGFQIGPESQIVIRSVNSIPLTMQKIDEADSIEEVGSSKRKPKTRQLYYNKETEELRKNVRLDHDQRKYREKNVEVVRRIQETSGGIGTESSKYIISSEKGMTVTEEYSVYLSQSSKVILVL